MKRYISFILVCFLAISIGWTESVVTSFETNTNDPTVSTNGSTPLSETTATDQENTPSSSQASENTKINTEETTFRHMLGFHGGMSSGAGLCYRQYVGKAFSWQLSFLPFYTSRDWNGKSSGFLIGGFFAQWFLSDFAHPAISLEGRFFIYAGAIAGYFVESEGGNDYTLGGGGGIGFETYVLKNIVFTTAVGYNTGFNRLIQHINSSMLSFEGTIGYRF
ncbi:hypothetical protein [Thermospira aquatica]|uniref:Outer membrane protein beta-barrel domain-containing protein n=1 Tax=Thermospira aquatica TaxID=2828656 RepID=A0AAX3BEG8_9SPIR|nr:hypothetical protein [Thermospira aquatica]URA10737.1 hypothetical protein KDW03_02740 [Thermospira aquatica]